MRISLFFLAPALLAACGGQAIESSDPLASFDAGTDSALGSDSPGKSDAKQTQDSALDSTVVPPLTPSPGQKILFELSRVNFAWAPTVVGAFITADGSVFTYDYYGTQPPDAAAPPLELKPGMTEEQLTGRFGPSPQKIGGVGSATLLSRFAMLAAVRNGALLTQFSCADYGDVRYVGYLYDPSSSTYTPVPLGGDGDMAVLNTAPEGDELIEWIRSLLGDTGERYCRYQTSSCQGQLCPGVPPCQDGYVPQLPTDQGCLGYCGSPSRCDQVDDCAVCAKTKEVCVIAPNGTAHCMGWLPGCTDTVACSCGGDSVCAGGAAYCHGDAANGLSCSPP